MNTYRDVGILFLYCSNSPVVKILFRYPIKWWYTLYMYEVRTLFYHFSFVWETTYFMSAVLTKFLKKLSSDSVWCSGKSSMIQVSTIDPLLPKETLQNKSISSYYVHFNITHTHGILILHQMQWCNQEPQMI